MDHVILDQLHLLLGILKVLIENLIRDALQWDQKDNWDKKLAAQKNIYLNELQKTVRSCGISFDIWEKTNADGKGSGQYDFTSLPGSDKKKITKRSTQQASWCYPVRDCENCSETLGGL